jgi:hypothetical protein
MQMHVSWYHSIGKHCIVLPVKFKNGLSISVLRKKSFFTKNRGSNFKIFKSRRKVRHRVLNSSMGREITQKAPKRQTWANRRFKNRLKSRYARLNPSTGGCQCLSVGWQVFFSSPCTPQKLVQRRNCDLLTPFICRELPISPKRDGQPTVVFHKQHDVMHIY